MMNGHGSGRQPAPGGGSSSSGGGSGGGESPPSSSSVLCSICLEPIDRSRSSATLQCGHIFHLDCIGSAFNVRRRMQCPNCRNVESGRWLFAGGNSSVEGIRVEGWISVINSEMSLYNQQWIPFHGMFWIAFPNGEVENRPEDANHNLSENEDPPHFGHPATSQAPTEAPVHNGNWSHIAAPAEVHGVQALPNANHYEWQHNPVSQNSTTISGNHASVYPAAQLDAGHNSYGQHNPVYMAQNRETIHGNHTSGYPATQWDAGHYSYGQYNPVYTAQNSETIRSNDTYGYPATRWDAGINSDGQIRRGSAFRPFHHEQNAGVSSSAAMDSLYPGSGFLSPFDDDDIPEWRPPDQLHSSRSNQIGIPQPPFGSSTWQSALGVANSEGSTSFDAGMANLPPLPNIMMLPERMVNSTDAVQYQSRTASRDQNELGGSDSETGDSSNGPNLHQL